MRKIFSSRYLAGALAVLLVGGSLGFLAWNRDRSDAMLATLAPACFHWGVAAEAFRSGDLDEAIAAMGDTLPYEEALRQEFPVLDFFLYESDGLYEALLLPDYGYVASENDDSYEEYVEMIRELMLSDYEMMGEFCEDPDGWFDE